MKQAWIFLLALLLCATLLLPAIAAGTSTDGGAALLDAGYVQCDDCGNWYKSGYEFDNHDCDGYEPWEYSDGGGWYMDGKEFCLCCACWEPPARWRRP